MSIQSAAAAEKFLKQETQFHLGFLPTEQSNPLTKDLDKRFDASPADGVRCLQRVDREVLAMARLVFSGKPYRKLSDTLLETIRNGRRVVFSGCGATGRLAILLESIWRDAAKRGTIPTQYADSVASIMTGGDFALIRSVEFFEDYASFGEKQVQELEMQQGDTLVAITEGGETSSVLGTVQEALKRSCNVFLLFNNPAELLAKHIERSRQAIEDCRVTVLDLSCGPMALAGSTRMQATTSEQLVAGAALEEAACQLAGRECPEDWAAAFAKMLEALEQPTCVQALADYLSQEASIYRRGGKVTYFADRFLLDIFTDTTERTPTFMLPPFRKFDDKTSPASWAFVKNPRFSTEETWQNALLRPLRCLNWTADDLRAMGAPEALAARPPAISAAEMLKIRIGNEDIAERCTCAEDTAVLVTTDKPADALAEAFQEATKNFRKWIPANLALWGVPSSHATPLELLDHLTVKLALNTISTGTMVLLGRVTGNWMSWVDATNKKLIDRSIRLVGELACLEYAESCRQVFSAMEEIAALPAGTPRPSPVQLALRKLGRL